MQGQANHFVRYAPEKIEYGIKRYTNETKRLYGVIERHLSQGREWLAAGQYTIADMANFSWIYGHAWAGVSLAELHTYTDVETCKYLGTHMAWKISSDGLTQCCTANACCPASHDSCFHVQHSIPSLVGSRIYGYL